MSTTSRHDAWSAGDAYECYMGRWSRLLAVRNAAIALDPKAAELCEGHRFAFCTPDGLAALCAEAGWPAVTVAPIEIEARFASFEEYGHPFTLGAGPAPGYCVSLPEGKRAALKERLKQDVGGAGPVSFTTRAWAVSGIRDQGSVIRDQ